MLGRFVADVLPEPSERPDVLPAGVGEPLADVRQVLENDVRTVVFDGLGDGYVGDTVEVLLETAVLLAADVADGLVRPPRPRLLYGPTAVFVLAPPIHGRTGPARTTSPRPILHVQFRTSARSEPGVEGDPVSLGGMRRPGIEPGL